MQSHQIDLDKSEFQVIQSFRAFQDLNKLMESLVKLKAPAVRGVGRPKKALDSERRFRRDIANNHERKRMQSINDGILALRRILHHKDIDKLSKATVLLRTAEYLINIEAKYSLLNEENYRLKCLTKELIHKRVTTALTVQQLLFTSNKSKTFVSILY